MNRVAELDALLRRIRDERGVTLIMILAAQEVIAGSMSLGDLVLVNAFTPASAAGGFAGAMVPVGCV